jgi:hypothetical protein
MKTAMQELIYNLDNTLVKSIFERLEKDGLFNKALEKEKEQIIAAREDGNMFYLFKSNEQYLNQTYNKPIL